MFEEIPNFARMREYVDPDGVRWRRRGDQVLTGKSLARRLGHPGLQVLHHYSGELVGIPATGRDAFWSEAQERMSASPHARFTGVEFRSDSGARLLVIDEDC